MRLEGPWADKLWGEKWWKKLNYTICILSIYSFSEDNSFSPDPAPVADGKTSGCLRPRRRGVKSRSPSHNITYVYWKNKFLTGIYLAIFLIQGTSFFPTCLGVFFILAWFWFGMTYAWEVVYLLLFQNSFQCPLTTVWIHKTAYFNSFSSICPFVSILIFSVICDCN